MVLESLRKKKQARQQGLKQADAVADGVLKTR